MSTQNMKRFLGFHSTWMSSSLPRDSGSTLELAESRAANFQDFCQLIWKNVWRCQGCWVDFTDTDSKQRDGHQGEAMGVGRGCSLPVFSPGAFISWCSSVPRRGDVNNSNCLQDAASNLNMIKLIWFYRLEFLSDRNDEVNVKYLLNKKAHYLVLKGTGIEILGNTFDLLEMKLDASFLGKNWILWSCFYTCCA